MSGAISRWVASMILLVTATRPSLVLGEEAPQERARAINERGRIADDLGNYDEAVGRYEEAYQIYPDRRILFNLAQVRRKQGEYDLALNIYRAVKRSIPLETAGDRALVARIDTLILEVEALKAAKSAAGSSVQARQETAVPTVRTKIEESRPWYSNTVGWWLLGGGAVAIGTGIGFFASASSLEKELTTATDTQRPGLRSDIDTRRTIGTVSTVVGGLAMAGGIAVFIWSPRTVTREIVPIDGLRVSLGPQSIALSGRF